MLLPTLLMRRDVDRALDREVELAADLASGAVLTFNPCTKHFTVTVHGVDPVSCAELAPVLDHYNDVMTGWKQWSVRDTQTSGRGPSS
jgi:hypothetical protein